MPGTKTQGYQKRALSDALVPAQLWAIFPGEGDNVYLIKNVGSGTYLDLTDGKLHTIIFYSHYFLLLYAFRLCSMTCITDSTFLR